MIELKDKFLELLQLAQLSLGQSISQTALSEVSLTSPWRAVKAQKPLSAEKHPSQNTKHTEPPVPLPVLAKEFKTTTESNPDAILPSIENPPEKKKPLDPDPAIRDDKNWQDLSSKNTVSLSSATAAPPKLKLTKQDKVEEKDFRDILDFLKSTFPKLAVLPAPLEYRAIAHTKPNVVSLLYDLESEEERSLLNNLAKSLGKHGHEAELHSATQFSADISAHRKTKLIVASKALLLSCTSLHAHIKRNPETRKLYFSGVQVMVISDLQKLLMDKEERRSIWNNLLNALQQ